MKIGIIGAGNVGSTIAYTLVINNIASEIVLVDTNTAKAKAEANDIMHATPVSHNVKINDGDYEDIKGAGIVIITAGSRRKPGQTRTDLLEINTKIFASIVPEIVKYAPESIIIIASNPVDVMAHITLKLSGFPPNRIIASGTILDTARLQSILSRHLAISPKYINAYVLGEHGDSQTLIWSGLKNGKITKKLMEDIDNEVRYGGKKIIEGKGATFYGIGCCVARLCQAIINDENAVFTVSSHRSEAEGIKDVFASYPTVINKNGIGKILKPEISNEEKQLLIKSIEAVKANTKTALAAINK
ncbi:MAG: L-lactate dehydrogenase [Lactobacillaceae bacterium]|jgi:L-lactate dehydrogenase|nr:L-lactate dehydrogenase [Lactobacillaceae bacterium]